MHCENCKKRRIPWGKARRAERCRALHICGECYKDEEVRKTAVRALIRIGEPVVMDISAIQDDKKRYARMAAVEVLGEIGSVQAMRKLEVALNDGDALVRETAGNKLEKIGLDAIKSLCRCLASPRKETARLAAKILLNLSPTIT